MQKLIGNNTIFPVARLQWAVYLFFTLLIGTPAMAQVDVTASAGNAAASYTTLKVAFDSINSGYHGGIISIGISAGTVETVSAVLNASGSGSASYTSISIQPTGGASRTITGAITGPLVDLNGADNVYIDGLNTGGNALTFSNTATGSASTVRFIADASNNNIENCTLLGSGTSVSFGTVFFSTGTTTGNDNNTIDSCVLNGTGANLPTNAIYCSGTGTAGIENSNNTISHSEIQNYFNAGAASSGILISAGATDWTISSNKFFQTATRTYTTGATHKVIGIAGGGNNFQVLNNIIGYSSSAGTGTYTMAGTVTTRLIGIEISAGTTMASSIQGNAFASISLATSSGAATTYGILCGINITGGNVNVGNLSGNTIGSTSGTGSLVATPTSTGGAIVGINSSSTGTIVIQNNSMGGFTSSGTTAAIAGGVFGVNVSAVAASITITNNTIGNGTTDNMRAGTLGLTTGSSSASGINAASIPAICSYSNNTIQNFASYGTGTSGYVRGIQTGIAASTTSIPTINNNTIHDLVTTGTTTALTNGVSAAMGIQFFPGTGATISGNTIYNISALGTGTTNVIVVGISHMSATNSVISSNRIYGLTNAGTATSTTTPSTVAGIAVRSGTTTTTVINNMVSLGTGQTTNTCFIGIWGHHGITPNPIDSIINNTVNIAGTVTAGAQPSFAFVRGDLTATARTVTVVLFNNIFSNTRTGGTGGHYAISNNYGSTVSATGWGAGTSDYNILNAADPAALGHWTSNTTFAAWKTAQGNNNDAHSYTAVPITFANAANDLHINMGTTPTILESSALPFANLTVDFDGNVRPGPAGSVNGGGVIPDFGADEFDGVPTDVAPPGIAYTNIPLTCTTADRTLTATITDASGMPLTGALVPRVYYKKTGGVTWFSQPGVYQSGTATNATWSFTVVAADMGGFSYGDSVQYYVIAQDSGALAVNIGSSPSGVTATDVNSVTVAPASPAFFVVGGDLLSSYTVNAANPTGGSNFQTFGALQYALHTGCLVSPVTVSVTAASGPYTAQLIIPAIVGSSAINTLTIDGNNDTLKFTPVTGSRHIIKLNGADYVTIRNLNIKGLATDYGWGVHLTDAADHDSILNCRIDFSANTATAADNCAAIAASASGTDINALGNNANYLVVDGCMLIGGVQTIVLNGGVSTKSTGNRITNDTIRDFYSVGIELVHNDQGLVEHNNIMRANRVAATTFEGVELGTGTMNTVVNANRIHDTHNSATSQTTGAYGIFSTADDATIGSENRITNNLIYNFNSTGGLNYGLYNSGSDGAFYYHNTVIFDNALATAGNTRGFFQSTIASNVDIRNNIFYITRAGTGDKYAIYFNTSTSTITSNKNDLYVNAPAGTSGVGYYVSGQVTLADWKAVNGSAYDQQSVSVNPLFSMPAPDFTPSAFVLNDAGDNVGVTTDINGVARPATPDIGAFEFNPPAIDAEVTWISPISPAPSGLHTITVNVTNNSSAATITDIELEYTDGTITQSQTFSGLTLLALTSQQFSFTTQYNLTANANLRAYIKNVNSIADGNQSNDTTALQSICIGLPAGSYTINSALATGSGNYQTFAAAVAAMTGCGILGPVIFNVDAASGPYTEQITIPEITNASAINTITFNGNGRTIQFTPVTAARHIIKLDGADYVKINDLHVVGLATDYDWGIHLINGADYDSITNCVIDMSANTSTAQSNSGGIAASGSTTTITTAGNANHLVIDGNEIIGAYQGVIINGTSAGLNAVQNIITNNTVHDFYATGIDISGNDGALVQDNDIHRSNRLAVGTFAGIELGAGNKNVRVNRNKIHDTHNSATSQSGTAYGIYSNANDAAVSVENVIANNLIYNINSLTGTQYGIYSNSSDGAYYYYNTITLDNAASTSGITRGFYQLTSATNVEVKNNIISITRGGSGAKNCLYFGTVASTIVSNYNLLYMNSPAGTVGVGYYSTNQVTLADWKLVNGGIYDQQSISASPDFNSPQILIPSPVSPVLAAGTPIAGITTDYLGTTRSVSTPSIGAYEVGGDFIAPSFLVSAVSGTASTANRTLTGLATITDISGVDTINNKPRIYYKKSTDNNTYAGNTSSDNGWKWAEATNTINPFDFVIDYSILNGGSISGGDTLQYFIVAQDNSANHLVGLSKGAFTTTPDSVDLTSAAFPITGLISSYRILATLTAGTYTVGSSGTYLNLTQVADLLNNNVIGGNIVFELQPDYDGVTTETFPISFNQISSTSPSNTVKIQPAASVTVPLLTTGNPSGAALITLNGAVNITFDGRPGGAGDTTDISWIIRNNRAAATFAPTFLFTNDAGKNTLQYLNIQSANSLATSGTIMFSTTNASFGNDSNSIRYNIIRDRSDSIGKPANAIYSDGTAGALNSANIIEYNRIFNWTTSGVNITGTGNGGGWEMRENYIFMIDSAFAAQTAIRFSAGSGENKIINNIIGGSNASAGGTAWINAGNIAWRGIVCASSTTDSTLIHNNTIQNISLTGGTGTYAAIELTGGLTSVRGNTIGHNTTPNSIQTSQLGTIISIWLNNANIVTQIYDNVIANINSTGTTTAIGVNGIRAATLNTTAPLIIRNNTIHDMTAANPTTSTGTASLIGILCNSANTDQRVLDNTIYNLTNVSLVGATRVFGINASTGTSQGVIRGNRIYNLNNVSPIAAANITGIHMDLANSWTVENNMVALGASVTNDISITGIFDKSATSTNRYYYNSVLVEGNSAGTVNTYGMWRTVATSNLDVKNNIFFNKRTSSGAGINYATGSSTAALITTNTFNYNLLVVNDTNKVSEFPSGSIYGVHAYNYDLFTPYGTYNTNWIEATSALSATNFFTNPATADLSIINTNAESWYANGKGIALAAYSGDFNNTSGVRSVDIASGPTDVGAVEFSTATTPPSAVQHTVPANSTTTLYTFANRPVASIDWSATGVVPSTLDVKFYSGDTAPSLLPSASRFSYYTSIVPSGGSGYTFDIALLYDSAYLGTVSTSANARTAQYNVVWEHLASSAVNTVSGLLNSNTTAALTFFGNFTGTDILNNPLPVTLTSFNATRANKDVLVYWTTASEVNADRFVVEASVDGKTYKTIGTVTAKGNSSVTVSYQLKHFNAQADMNNANVVYYRLTSVDKNGTSERSKTISVAFDKQSNSIEGTVAYPNPFSSAITLSIPSDVNTSASIEIMDLRGRVISKSTEQLTEGLNTINITNLQDFETGIYFIKTSANGVQKVIKMIKD